MKISKNAVVVLTYELKLEDGHLADAATAENPFAFIHEIGQTIPAFDENLAGLIAGDTFSFVVKPAEAYGEYDETQIQRIDAKVFANAPKDMLFVGNVLPMVTQDGDALDGQLVEMNDEFFTIDFNHPLAGEELHFSGKIIEVRPATSEELAHGHVHGLHGHHH
jgi:FKBP-type peptidyl-prolyl cis-trans isomerase SlyD